MRSEENFNYDQDFHQVDKIFSNRMDIMRNWAHKNKILSIVLAIIGILGILFVLLERLQGAGLFSNFGMLIVSIAGFYSTNSPSQSKAMIYQILAVVIFTLCSSYIFINLLVIVIWNNLDQFSSNLHSQTAYTIILIFFLSILTIISLLAAAVSAIRFHLTVKGI